MIRSFRHRALEELWRTGRSRRIDQRLAERTLRRLDALDAASRPTDMALPGFDFHPLRGKPARYTVHVNGPWCITFAWDGNDAIDVNLEQYH